MQRGAEKVAAAIISEQFNPNHRDDYDDNEGAKPSPENKAYRERMQAQVKDR